MKKKTMPIECSFTDYFQQHHPGVEDITSVSVEQLTELRKNYINDLLAQDFGELNEVEKIVSKSINDRRMLAEVPHGSNNRDLPFGARLADKVASFGGSWRFIIIFFIILIMWMALNAWLLHEKGFDPYPFILLNLILSCLASIQAPIIMMSQNRQEEKDRKRAEHDYKVNLKAEVEIRMLHEKLDHLLLHQNKRLLEIQKVEVEMLEGIAKAVRES